MTDVRRRNLLGSVLFAVFATTLASTCVHAAEKNKPRTHPVDITPRGFSPARVTVKVGDRVSWSNNDARDHTVTAANRAFSSGNIKPEGGFSFRFTKAGTYKYSCSLHPRMKGTVVVQP